MYSPAHDVARILSPRYSPYVPGQRQRDWNRKFKNKTNEFCPAEYVGFQTKTIYKAGIKCIYVIYVSELKKDHSIQGRFWTGGQKFRDWIRSEKIGKLKRCRKFMEYTRQRMAVSGYVEVPAHIHTRRNTSMLYFMLPKRFYADMDRYARGFNEMDVLARLDQNKRGLLGCFIIHRVLYSKKTRDRHSEKKYVLRPMEYGSIPREFLALSLRELLLYGYYKLGRSSESHLNLLTSYWEDKDRKIYYPPEKGFVLSNDITYGLHMARRRKFNRLIDRFKGTYNAYLIIKARCHQC